MFRLSSKVGNMALRIDLHIFPCQRFEIWDPADFSFSVQLPKILRPTSNTALFSSQSLMLSTPLSSSPKTLLSTVLILWDDIGYNICVT